MSLYTFNDLDQFLNQQGFPQAGAGTFQLLKRNLAQGLQQGEIAIRADGIYCTIDGHEYRGYIFNEKPDISTHGISKFHVADCQIALNRGKYDGQYVFTTSESVQLYDRGNGNRPYPELDSLTTLNLCGYCRRLIDAQNSKIASTEDFHAMLLKQYGEAAEPESQDVDIFGYTRDFTIISKKIRELRSWQCEKCQLDLSGLSDRRFLHVHHLNGRKTNNHPQNLQCLCIRCHSTVDLRHENNFATPNHKHELEAFRRKFPKA